LNELVQHVSDTAKTLRALKGHSPKIWIDFESYTGIYVRAGVVVNHCCHIFNKLQNKGVPIKVE